jgi:hypothetical protein
MEFLFRRLDFAGHGIFSRLTDRWKGPDQPLVIGLALQVGGCGRSSIPRKQLQTDGGR